MIDEMILWDMKFEILNNSLDLEITYCNKNK
jgi:hypothetical protein